MHVIERQYRTHYIASRSFWDSVCMPRIGGLLRVSTGRLVLPEEREEQPPPGARGSKLVRPVLEKPASAEAAASNASRVP